jgi:phospholipid/cholesterol/gamma-HCH transport system substrate-binding protein
MIERMPPRAPSPAESGLPSLAQLRRRALAMLVLMVAVVAVAVGYVLYARGVFEPKQTLVLLLDDADGVSVGMDLTFAGFAIGRVERIELGADAVVRVDVAVPRTNAHWLRTSSVVTLERSLVGGTRLRAYSGVLTDPPLPAGASLTVLKGDALAELPAMMASIKDILGNVERLTRAEGPLARALGHTATVAERAAGRQGVLAALVGSDESAQRLLNTVVRAQALIDRLEQLTRRTDTLVAHADAQVFGAPDREGTAPTGLVHEAQGVAQDLRTALQGVQRSLAKVDALLTDAQAVAANTRTATADLGALRAEVEASLRTLQSLLADVQRRWPLARPSEVVLP